MQEKFDTFKVENYQAIIDLTDDAILSCLYQAEEEYVSSDFLEDSLFMIIEKGIESDKIFEKNNRNVYRINNMFQLEFSGIII